MRVAIKDNWTKFPFGLVVKPLGGVGIDRSPKKPGGQRRSQVEGMADLFKKYDDIGLVIAAEGTRKPVKKWKMGFYYVAKQAEVPILCGYLDYKNKIAGIGSYVFYAKDDMEGELKPVMDFYSGITGCNPEQFFVDERYA
jgi:1-acyl-sn-glycerol-3-phosphate acyltransferase